MKIGISKREFIDKYSELLQMTREGLSHIELKDDDTVTVHYDSGYIVDINIACNSGMAIIRDVAKMI